MSARKSSKLFASIQGKSSVLLCLLAGETLVPRMRYLCSTWPVPGDGLKHTGGSGAGGQQDESMEAETGLSPWEDKSYKNMILS